MTKYYLFIIKNDTYKVYKNNPKYLYEIINTLYHLKYSDLNYGINLYNTLCDTFSVKLLKNYIVDRFNTRTYKKRIKLNKEKTYIRLNYSKVEIETDLKIPPIFKIFNIYNKKIFVINFKEKRYFWLNDEINDKKNI